MRCRVLVLTLVLGIAFLVSNATAQQTPPGPQKPQAPVAPASPAVQPRASVVTATIHVTNSVGAPVAEVEVRATGPVDRRGITDAEGLVQFIGLAGGMYRLHFEREAFITLERDVTIRVGQPSRVDVMLTTAPRIVTEAPAPPPPPPPLPPPPPPPPPPAETPRRREPTTVSIPTFLDRNFIGREGTKESVLDCTDAERVRLLQVRDPLREHVHTSADEALYVVAGEGTVRLNGRDEQVASGTLSIIPRGNVHELSRRGRNPVIALSILFGASCESTAGESPTPR